MYHLYESLVYFEKRMVMMTLCEFFFQVIDMHFYFFVTYSCAAAAGLLVKCTFLKTRGGKTFLLTYLVAGLPLSKETCRDFRIPKIWQILIATFF